jgi:hypothetical protein
MKPFRLNPIPFTPKELKKRAARFNLIESDSFLGNEEVFIDKRKQIDRSFKYAISTNGNSVLTKLGDFEYEPLPSSRDSKYLNRARFDTLEEAWSFWNAWVEK